MPRFARPTTEFTVREHRQRSTRFSFRRELCPLFVSVSSVVWLLPLVAACYRPPPEALILNGGTLTVNNHTRQDWSNVEVWLNTYYRATFKTIPARGRMQAPLNFFVAGFGQRFNFDRMQVRDLRLTAKLPDGQPFEVKKEFEIDGLDGVLREMQKKR
jgi:hypothetical protein